MDLHYKNLNYEEATRIPQKSVSEKIIFLLLLLKDTLITIVIITPIILKLVYMFFFPVNPKSLRNEVALVTGGGNGLGRAICLELAKAGCHVAVVDVDVLGADKTAKEINDAKLSKAVAYQVDVSNPAKIEELKDKIYREFGKVDILINNAGLIPILFITEGSKEQVKKTIEVNLLAHLWLIRTFLPGMVERRHGHIVATASIAGFMGNTRSAVYTSTKYAVRGLMHSLDNELQDGGSNIKTTCICPYFINTRKEFIDKFELRFPAMTAEYVAQVSVDAIRRNVKELTVPKYFYGLFLLLNFLPKEVQLVIKKKIFNQDTTVKSE